MQYPNPLNFNVGDFVLAPVYGKLIKCEVKGLDRRDRAYYLAVPGYDECTWFLETQLKAISELRDE